MCCKNVPAGLHNNCLRHGVHPLLLFGDSLSVTANIAGIFCVPVLGALSPARDDLRLLLRAYISDHQTSEQGRLRSRWSWSKSGHDDHVSSRNSWTYSAAGERISFRNRPQVVTHRTECSTDHGRRHRLLLDLFHRWRHRQRPSTFRG